jgi:FkbM family methyltransferase
MLSGTRDLKRFVKRCARSLGYDIVRVPRRDHTLAGHLMPLFAALAIDCVLDVGGREGWYGRFLREAGYSGPIVSFEPVTANLAVLRAEAAADPRWHVAPIALGSAEERRTINVTRETGLSSFLEPSAYCRSQFEDDSIVERTERVEVRPLDDLFDQQVARAGGSRVFLKIDAQGWELEILRGANGCLGRVLALQAEIPLQRMYDGVPDLPEMFSAIGALGFEATGLFPVRRDAKMRVIAFDGVFRRAVIPARMDLALASRIDASSTLERGK